MFCKTYAIHYTLYMFCIALMMALLRPKHVALCTCYFINVLMYIRCISDGNIHISATKSLSHDRHPHSPPFI